MGIRAIIEEFEKGNVCVVGEKGSGKDMLMANVVVRRKLPYVSNVVYDKKQHINYHPKNYDCGGNTFRHFINGTVNYYEYPHDDKTDIYVSDAGIYFPSQYNGELDKEFPYLPTFCALIRHLGDASFHCNAQDIRRIYLKIREQSHRFISCKQCIVLNKKIKWFPKIVIQKVIIYSREQSCVDDIEPFSLPYPLFAKKEVKQNYEIEFQRYRQKFGRVQPMILIYWNKSKYDTRRFKDLLRNGSKIKVEYDTKGNIKK